ncbi:structural maintenance of chromosomes protein 4-like [Schistocerca cancellata]|uniref:structural maintenance of chromosomes protein 4-like n=1 Tax=Schistocerca cancellata TaxID=274614 RepID=UPI002119A8C3|nr:structural maintenance of chromosomes protein 4-like [Schistocerca cancellata]
MQLQKKVEELKEEEEVKVESYKNVLKDKQQLEGPKNEVLNYMKAENEIAKLRNELMQKYIKDNQELIDKKEQEKSELQRMLGEKLSEVEIIQKEKKKLLENIHELNQERDQQVMKKDKLNQKSGSYNNEGAGLKTGAEAAAEKQARLNELLQDEKKQLSDYEELYEKYQGQLMKFKDEEIQINSDCIQLDAQLKEALEHIQEDIANLCEEKDSLQYKLTKIQEVVDGKKSQYEVAKSELEVYVLPERTEKEKLKLLIQNLEKMTERLLKTKEPENAPRLIDLIKLADERVRVAFYFALRNTLVANDVAQATRVAFSGGSRYRVVNLQGHIIEATGEMTGGGHTVKKGLMSQKVPEAPVTQKTLEDLGKSMQECQKKLEEFTKKINEIDKKMCFLTPEINNMKTKTQKLETEIMFLATYDNYFQTLQREHPKLEHEVKNQEKRVLEVTIDPEKFAALTLVLEKAKKDYDDAMQKAQEVSSEVNCLSNEIEDKINNRVGLIKKNIEKNKKKLSSKCYEITKTKADIKRAERNIMKSNKKIEEINEEIVHLENVINVYKNRNSYLLNLVKDINIELNKVTESITDLEKNITSMQNEVKSAEQIEFQKRAEVQELEASVDAKERTIKAYKAKNPSIIQKMKSLKIHKIPGEDVDTQLQILTSEQIDRLDVKNLQYTLAVLEEKVSMQKPNFAALEEYTVKEKLLLEQYAALEKLKNLQGKTNLLYDEARKQRFLEFVTGYRIIAKVLKEIYQIITFGGDAEIEMLDKLDPFNEGIIFSVRPPGKAWKNIEHLSGGEKSLSSLALIFALHFYKPSPLFFMDEIDAALDFNNVAVVGNYIKNRCKNAQFIVISLRSNMFELADRTVGIFKVHDCTESMTINPKTYAKVSPEQQKLLESDLEYEILEDIQDEISDDNLLPLPNNKDTMRRRGKRRIKIKEIGEHGSAYSLMNILQSAFTAMMGNVETSSPIVETREEIEERIRRKRLIYDHLDQKKYADLMKEFVVKKDGPAGEKGSISETDKKFDNDLADTKKDFQTEADTASPEN